MLAEIVEERDTRVVGWLFCRTVDVDRHGTSSQKQVGFAPTSAGLVLQGPLGEHAGQVLPVLLVGVDVLARLGAFRG